MAKPHMLRFQVFHFPVTVEFWFWITCLLLGGGLRPEAYASVASLANLGIWAILVFISILIHELGHASTGRRYGADPEIVLHGFGGAAVMHGARFNRRQDLLVTAAGPIASVILGTLSLITLRFVPISAPDIRDALVTLVWINYFWTFINLLPIQPLDGGLLLRTSLGDRRLTLTSTIGFVCAAGMALLALSAGMIFLTLLMAVLAFENWRLRQR
jgi:Zn-dependent protease